MPTVDDYPVLDLIAVGAHPDDAEIACGGTLARLVQLGYRVGIVDLTDGEPTPGCPDPAIRRAEAQAAADLLGVSVRVILNLPNRRLFDSFESRVALATELRKYRPRIVLGFGDKTPLASPDHWQAMQITDAAVFYSRLTKWDHHFQDLPPHRVQAQLYFKLSVEHFAGEVGRSEVVMDISHTLQAKMQSLECYTSQFPPEKYYVLDRVKAAALQAGTSAGFAAGEAFASAHVLGTGNLIRFLLEDR